MNANNMIRTIAVAGNKFSGWIAATMLSVMLAPLGVKIKFVASKADEDISSDRDICTSNCFLNQFHLLNILEVSVETFIEKCNAGFRIGDQYLSEDDPSVAFIQSFSGSSLAFGRVSLQEIMARLNNEGIPILAEDLSYEVQKALLGHPLTPLSKALNRESLSVIGVSFYKSAFVKLFEDNRARLAIDYIESTIIRPNIAINGRISSLITDVGSVEADLYIDCTGDQRQLIGALSQTDTLGSIWQEHKTTVPPSGVHQFPFSRYTFLKNSITRDITLLSGIESVRFYTDITGDTPSVTKINFSRAHRPWVNNCISVGDAMANIGSFAIHEIDLVQQIIPFLVELFPRKSGMSHLANYFNYVTREQIARYWDFTYLMLHSPVLLTSSTVPDDTMISEPLKKRLGVYQSTARILISDYEVLSEAYWSSYLLGWHWHPKSWSVDCDLLDLNVIYSRLMSERLEIQKYYKTLCAGAMRA